MNIKNIKKSAESTKSTKNAKSTEQAFTIIEVMISMAILATAFSALASSIYTVNESNQFIDDNRRAVEISQIIIEKIQSEAWQELGKNPSTWHRSETIIPTLVYSDQVPHATDQEFMHRPMVDEPPGINIYEFIRHGVTTGFGARTGAAHSSTMGHGSADITKFTRDRWGYPYVMVNQKSAHSDTDVEAVAPLEGVPLALVTKYNTPLRYNWLQFLGILNQPSGLTNLKVYVEYYDMETMKGVNNRDDWETAIAIPANKLAQSHVLLDMEEVDDLDARSVVIRVVLTWTRRNQQVGRHEVTVARRQ